MTKAGPSARLADESWWSAEIELRHNLTVFLAGHLVSPDALRTPLLVVGGPGAGKSMLAEMLAARLPRDEYSVISVPLRGVDPDASVADQVGPDFAAGHPDRIRVVLLDGLDEMLPAASGHQNYLDEVVRFQQAERPAVVLITCRTSFLDHVPIPDGMTVVQLAALDTTQVEDWIEAWNRSPASTGRRPMTWSTALAHPELAKNPLLFSMLIDRMTDPESPPPNGVVKATELYERFWEGNPAGLWMSGMAAVCSFNRHRLSISEAELHADLVELGHHSQADWGPVLREFDALPASFAEYQAAAFLMEAIDRVVAPTWRDRSGEDQLFALLSHRLLALRPQILVFMTELAEALPPVERAARTRTLDDLVRRHRDWQNITRPSAVCSANLVLLRLFSEPADEPVTVGRDLAVSLTGLWLAGLAPAGLRSMRSLVLVEGEVIVRRPAAESAANEQSGADALPPGVEMVHRALTAGPEAVGQVTWSCDGTLLTTNSGGRVVYWAFSENSPPKRVGGLRYVSDVAWHPARRLAAVVQHAQSPRAQDDPGSNHVVLTEFDLVTSTRSLCNVATGTRIDWSPDGESLALLNADGLRTIDVTSGEQHEVFWFSRPSRERTPRLPKPRWSGDGTHIWAADADSVRVFPIADATPHVTYQYGMEALDVVMLDDMRGVVAAADAGRADVEIHFPGANKASVVLEGHTKRVTCARFSPEGGYLATMSTDNTVRIWRCEDWQCVAVLPRKEISGRGGLAFHPAQPLLAVKDDNGVDVVRLDHQVLGTAGAAQSSRRYANAKIVLVGDTGVGKSGLGLVLSGQPFVATESTHGRNVWTFEKFYATTPSGDVQTRETLLWDLAGQPGYRMVHQLHLNEVAVALVVFDARSETDPFAGVQYWRRALAQARRLDGAAAVRLRTFLVAARSDRGGTAVSRARIEQAAQALGFDGYVETSAKEGWGVEELVRTIRDAVDWDAVPAVSSTALFQSIKDFVLEEKKQGRILTTVDDLLHTFRRVRADETPADELADGFSACLGRLESVGVVRRMAFGDYVLLRPELLDSYASSLVQAAKDEPDGLGFVPEADALEGRFRMPGSERLTNAAQERVLLITVVQELLRREIALKEVTDREVDLIFPSQFTRERPDAPQLPGQDVVFTFDGHLYSIYSTLAVRLSHSRLFRRDAMWHNSASYLALAGGTCGIAIREIEEGKGELVLFYDDGAQPIVRRQFEAYVVEHLGQRAAAGTLVTRRMRTCPACRYTIPDDLVRGRLDRGKTKITCPRCDDSVIALVDEPGEACDVRPAVAAMNSNANAQRDQDVAAATLRGKREAEDYDVFLSHNVQDKAQVLEIARQLEARGILPWLDVREIQPGSRWQPQMAKGIEKSRAAAVLLGPSGRGPWHEAEIELIHHWSVQTGKRVIPVILDGTEEDFELPGFTKVWCTVDMRLANPDPVEQLIWGITGDQPRWA